MEKFSFLAPEAVKNHPTNCSPSKALYRFSNSKRFKPANPECPTAFYSNLSGLSQRQTSIGFGKKLDFTKPAMITPSGSDYNPDIKWMKQGKTFGCSRDKSLDRSYIPPQIQSHPGVGAVICILFSMCPKSLRTILLPLAWGLKPSALLINTIQLPLLLDLALMRDRICSRERKKSTQVSTNVRRWEH